MTDIEQIREALELRELWREIEALDRLVARVGKLENVLQNCVDFWPSALNDDLQQRTFEEARAALPPPPETNDEQ